MKPILTVIAIQCAMLSVEAKAFVGEQNQNQVSVQAQKPFSPNQADQMGPSDPEEPVEPRLPIEFGNPSYGGAGCPGGFGQVEIKDGTIQMKLADFNVEAGVERKLARKSCSIAIPAQVLPGYSVAFYQSKVTGFASLEEGAMARITSEYFFAGSKGPRWVKNLRGPYDNDFIIQKIPADGQLLWSPCGASTNLRVNLSALVRTSANSEGFISLGSEEETGLSFSLRVKECQ